MSLWSSIKNTCRKVKTWFKEKKCFAKVAIGVGAILAVGAVAAGVVLSGPIGWGLALGMGVAGVVSGTAGFYKVYKGQKFFSNRSVKAKIGLCVGSALGVAAIAAGTALTAPISWAVGAGLGVAGSITMAVSGRIIYNSTKEEVIKKEADRALKESMEQALQQKASEERWMRIKASLEAENARLVALVVERDRQKEAGGIELASISSPWTGSVEGSQAPESETSSLVPTEPGAIEEKAEDWSDGSSDEGPDPWNSRSPVYGQSLEGERETDSLLSSPMFEANLRQRVARKGLENGFSLWRR